VSAPSFSIASRYLRQGLVNGTLPHALVFKGPDASVLYDAGLRLAQRLNCAQPDDTHWDNGMWGACGHCQNCRWTLNNQHPSVITVSRLTGLVDDKSAHKDYFTQDQLDSLARKKTVQKQIKTAQIARLIQQVSRSSDTHRVVIFTDAQVLPASPNPTLTPQYPPPAEWANTVGNATQRFMPQPLSRAVLNASGANRFLKTLEEPPPGVLILFLVRHEQDILETLVSRCQVIPFFGHASTHQSSQALVLNEEPDEALVPLAITQPLLQGLIHPQADTFALVTQLMQGVTEADLPLTSVLLATQHLARQQAVVDQSLALPQYPGLLQRLETGLAMLQAKLAPERVLEHLLL
jgi:hypothetical protein